MTDRNCASCAAYLSVQPGVGECHMNPPQVQLINNTGPLGTVMTVQGIFPPTKNTNWCLAWRASEAYLRELSGPAQTGQPTGMAGAAQAVGGKEPGCVCCS